MTPLQKILENYRATSHTEREKGTYFEELIRTYFRFEASYADLYSDVWLFADWAKTHGFSAKDTGIDLVAKTHGTEEFHAIPENTCRILSNVRCLSEGVDVPALDAVLFLTPRNSQVDVVQSVGRVMRRTPDGKKKLGYVILPVVIPAGMEPHEALNDNKVYKVVWDVLQALRSHDDRFDAMINKLDLIGSDHRKMEVIAITDSIQKKAAKSSGTTNAKAGKNEFSIGTPETPWSRKPRPNSSSRSASWNARSTPRS
jgi:predicted helicase